LRDCKQMNTAGVFGKEVEEVYESAIIYVRILVYSSLVKNAQNI